MMIQNNKDTVEAVGLLKMDFLGLRNLSLMASALHYVQRQTGKPLAITKIDLNDPATLKLFQAGDTTGVFQFESAGIRNVLRRLHPDNFELVAAVTASHKSLRLVPWQQSKHCAMLAVCLASQLTR
ncbi:hypothetical protein WP50_23050 [Lactiplantibacillus plantarum]|nr:hypothetical protein WP50_23050 [Lactiplantibacillus plantarum]